MNKSIFRALWRKKTFTILNIVGLAVGTGACLVLFLLIRYELSFDTFHTHGDRVFRVDSEWTGAPDGTEITQGVPVPMTAAIRADFPQFQKVAAFWGTYGGLFTVPGNKKFAEHGDIVYTEPELFDMLDFPWLAGDPASLKNPNTMAIEESVAKSWFGDWHLAMGKTVVYDHIQPFIITGVMKDHPENTDIPIRIAMSWSSSSLSKTPDWHDVNSASNCFALLAPGQTIRSANAGIAAFDKTHFVGETGPEKSTIFFQPLRNIHFTPHIGTYPGDEVDPSDIWALALIGVFLLLVACINFINLATAQSVGRAKEIGVRKVLGSSRASLIRQFLGETALIAFIAILLGCILAEIGSAGLEHVLGKPLHLNVVKYPSTLLFLGAIWAFITFLGGFYPALVLSGFNPVAAIKSKISTRTVGGLPLRRVLVVVQFATAQILVIGTLVVVAQMNYFRTIPLGFDKNAVAIVDVPSDSLSLRKLNYLKQVVLQEPGVADASLCSQPPSSGWVWDNGFTFNNRPKPEDFSLGMHMVDTSYFSTFHIKLLAGRLFYPCDTMREVVLSEKAVLKLGFSNPADIIGKSIAMRHRTIPIVGVIADFHSTSLQNELSPMALSTESQSFRELAVRLEPSRIGATMKRVQADWEKVFPDFVYKSVFLDDDMAQFYEDEERTGKLFQIFAGIALFISCLGLYGLVSFMAVQRTREVGIRKVLGASLSHIIFLFSKEYTLLVVGAFGVSAPLGYYFMRHWLNGFYYRVHLGWETFLLAIAGSLLIAWLTVGYKSLRAALANPVQSLRNE